MTIELSKEARAQAIESLHVECLGAYTHDEGTAMLRDAIATCSEERVFQKSMRRVRSAATTKMDELLHFLPHLKHFRDVGTGRVLDHLLSRYFDERDRTVFGLMNAVTSVARDTHDPELRWNLEELGGGIGAMLLPKQPSDAPGQQRAAKQLMMA